LAYREIGACREEDCDGAAGPKRTKYRPTDGHSSLPGLLEPESEEESDERALDRREKARVLQCRES